MFEKRPKYVGNDVDLLGNDSNMWENDLIIDKLLKNVENDLEICEMAKIFGKWLRYMVHGLSIYGLTKLENVLENLTWVTA